LLIVISAATQNANTAKLTNKQNILKIKFFI